MGKRLCAGILVMMALWLLSTPSFSLDAQTECPARSTPFAPQPVDSSEVLRGDVTLRWMAWCADGYEVLIDNTLVATLAESHLQVTAQPGVIQWQVIVLQDNGTRGDGPLWRFTVDSGEWLATPYPLPDSTRLYIPEATPQLSSIVRLDLGSPSTAIPLTCGATCGGLLLILSAAWMLGLRAQRRAESRLQRPRQKRSSL